MIKDKCSNEDALNKILNLDGDSKTISKNELRVLLRLLDKSSNEIYEDGYDNKYDTALQDVSDDELQRTYKLTQGTSARCSWGDITKNDQQRIIMPLKINGGKEITVIVESSEETEFFKNIFKNLDPETLLNISKEIDVIRFAPNGDKSVYKPDTNEILINISPPKGGWQPSNGLRPAESIARSLTHEVAHALDANKVGQFDSSNDAKFKELFGQLQDVLKEMGIEHTNSHDNYLLSNETEYLAEYRASSGGQGKTDGSSSYDELLEQLRDMASRGQNTEKVQEAFKLIKNLDLLADNLITNAENADKNERVPANSQSYA